MTPENLPETPTKLARTKLVRNSNRFALERLGAYIISG
jgi:hypothetical protein